MTTLPEARPAAPNRRSEHAVPVADEPLGPLGTLRRGLFRAGARACSAALRWKARWGRAALVALAVLALPPLLLAAALAYHVYFDRTGLPDFDAFVSFEPPTTGEVRDARGQVLIALAREHRRMVTFDELPPILRQAILATEDEHFFSHSGV